MLSTLTTGIDGTLSEIELLYVSLLSKKGIVKYFRQDVYANHFNQLPVSDQVNLLFADR
jgi:hypothetical protein